MLEHRLHYDRGDCLGKECQGKHAWVDRQCDPPGFLAVERGLLCMVEGKQSEAVIDQKEERRQLILVSHAREGSPALHTGQDILATRTLR